MYNIKDLLGYYMYVMIPENELDTRNMQQRKLGNWCQVVQKMCTCVCLSLSAPQLKEMKNCKQDHGISRGMREGEGLGGCRVAATTSHFLCCSWTSREQPACMVGAACNQLGP